MVLLASSYDQSNYLRAEDVPQEKTLRIKSATEEHRCRGRAREEARAFGSPTPRRGWCSTAPTTARSGPPTVIRSPVGPASSSSCSQTQADFRGRLVPALRVRIPPPKQASGNGQTAKTKSDRGRSRDIRPSCSGSRSRTDDMDDEIPF